MAVRPTIKCAGHKFFVTNCPDCYAVLMVQYEKDKAEAMYLAKMKGNPDKPKVTELCPAHGGEVVKGFCVVCARVGKPKTVSDLLDTRTGAERLKPESALDMQIGGAHYMDRAIQPIQFIEANELGFLEGCVVKRVTRHNQPTGKGRQDIEKAIHELQLLLELRYGKAEKA